MTELKGKIFNIQRYCLDDGQGIRTAVFFKGCALRCLWCHNVESQSFNGEIGFYKDNCIGCNECVISCPHGAIDNLKKIDTRQCDLCGECVDNCFSSALVLTGKDMTVAEIFDVVRRDKPFYINGGGVTLTGGEVMCQPELAIELSKLCHKEGISVNIETSGWGNKADFEKIALFCDCFLFDCKASDNKHKELTGVENKVITDNLDTLCKTEANVILRVPIVPGANLEREFIEKVKELACKYNNIKQVHLLPYHKTGLYKCEVYGKEKQQEFSVPSSDILHQTAEYLKKQTCKEVRVI